MDTALLGVLLGFALAIIYKAVDLLTLRREEQRQAEEHARSRAELDARWQEIEERHHRIATLLENLPTARRKRELREAMSRDEAEGYYSDATIAAGEELLGLESDPEQKTRLTAQLSVLYNNRGRALDDLRRYEEALSDYNRSLELSPDHPTVISNRAFVLAALGRYGEAFSDFNRSLELRPDHPDTLTNRGATLGRLGRHEEALTDFNRSLGLRPDHPDTLSNRGIALRHLRRHEEALADFLRSLELRPDHPDTLNNRGATLAHLGRHNEALADFNCSLELRPDHPITLHNRGIALAHLGRDEEALADFNHALALFQAAGDTEKAQLARQNLELLKARKDGMPIEEAFHPILIPTLPERVAA